MKTELALLTNALGFIYNSMHLAAKTAPVPVVVEIDSERNGKVLVQVFDPEERCAFCDNGDDEGFECRRCDGTGWEPITFGKAMTADAQMREVELTAKDREAVRKAYVPSW